MIVKNFGKIVDDILPADKYRTNSLSFYMKRKDGRAKIDCRTGTAKNFKHYGPDHYLAEMEDAPYSIIVEFDKPCNKIKELESLFKGRCQTLTSETSLTLDEIAEVSDAVASVKVVISYLEKNKFTF
jgi:hypothetical protein